MATAVARQIEQALMVDYTPSGAAIAAGDMVVVGAHVYVCHRPIADGALGALAESGGVYRSVAGASVGASVDLYLNVATGKLNKLASATSGDKHVGHNLPQSTAAADGDLIDWVHRPNGTAKA